jgi:Ca-activated chloride channel family protein
MFYLDHPWFLVLLPAVPLVVWLWLRQRRGTLQYPDTGLLAALPVGRARAARGGAATLRGAILTLLVLALSGPRIAEFRSRVPTEGIGIALLLDVSGSMAAKDFQWQDRAISRLDAARQALRLFVAGGEGPDGTTLDGRPNDLIGVVTFASRPECPCPLTLSHSVLLGLLDKEEPRSVPGESETSLSDALALGLHRLESTHLRRKVIVLLTDGEDNVPHPKSGWTPRQAAQIAANLHVPIYTIDAGSEAGSEDYPGGKPLDPQQRAQTRASAERTLHAVASLSGGRYFEARDTRTLLDVCKEIDRLEKGTIQSFQYERYHDLSFGLGLAALALTVLLQVLEQTMWLRVP